jgi:hypothetical protein
LISGDVERQHLGVALSDHRVRANVFTVHTRQRLHFVALDVHLDEVDLPLAEQLVARDQLDQPVVADPAGGKAAGGGGVGLSPTLTAAGRTR